MFHFFSQALAPLALSPLSLHDALPIYPVPAVLVLHVVDHLLPPLLAEVDVEVGHGHPLGVEEALEQQAEPQGVEVGDGDRKSTRLNSSHVRISYAVFCLKKKT